MTVRPLQLESENDSGVGVHVPGIAWNPVHGAKATELMKHLFTLLLGLFLSVTYVAVASVPLEAQASGGRLSRQQKEVREYLRAIEEQMERVAERIRQNQPQDADKIESARTRLLQGIIYENMKGISGDLQADRYGPALVTKRMKGLDVDGRRIFQVGLPIHWGFIGRVKGPLVNNLTASVLDPNSGTPEYKGFLVNVEKLG